MDWFASDFLAFVGFLTYLLTNFFFLPVVCLIGFVCLRDELIVSKDNEVLLESHSVLKCCNFFGFFCSSASASVEGYAALGFSAGILD